MLSNIRKMGSCNIPDSLQFRLSSIRLSLEPTGNKYVLGSGLMQYSLGVTRYYVILCKSYTLPFKWK